MTELIRLESSDLHQGLNKTVTDNKSGWKVIVVTALPLRNIAGF